MTNQFPGNAISAINSAQNFLNANNNPLTQSQQQSYEANGFLLPATYSADQNGLPYTNVPANRQGRLNRNIITWFVPQFGTVRMYINPQNISYGNKKLITKDRTKGGFTLQYWGEDLTTINMSGTTGSSGVEGINVLYQIYRAEQYAFDAVGLTLAANNAAADVANNIVNGVGGALGNSVNQLFGGSPNSPSAAAAGASILGGVLGMDSPNNNLAAQNIPSLAELAFTVEFFWNGEVYRGYFDSFTVNFHADNFLVDYSIVFMATQRRGMQLNYFPFQHAANQGPSQATTPHSYSSGVLTGTQ
jgi:hypothetical protein